MVQFIALAALVVGSFAEPTVLLDGSSLVQAMVRPTEPPMAAGDYAEVLIEEGPRNGTWLPCKITRTLGKTSFSYDIHVASGPALSHYQTNLERVESRLMRPLNESDYQAAYDALTDNREGKALLVALEKDQLRLVREMYRKKGLSPEDVQKKVEKLQADKRANIEMRLKKNGCPEGYLLIKGDCKGADQFGRGISNKLETIDMCAQDCNDRDECLSFEFNINNRVCNLNKKSEPDIPMAANPAFMFCQRTKLGTDSAAAATVPL